jgi:hypothetical protein
MSDATLNDFGSQRADWVAAPVNEDWLAVLLGLAIFVLALAALANVDLIGWVVTTSVWSNLGQALKATSKGFSSLGGIEALFATYAALLIVLSASADRLCKLGDRQFRAFRRGDVGRATKIRHQLVAETHQ